MSRTTDIATAQLMMGYLIEFAPSEHCQQGTTQSKFAKADT